jgi:hypothetical protein
MEYLKSFYNYYFVKEIKKDDENIKEIKQKIFDVNSFDNEVVNRINLIMFKK